MRTVTSWLRWVAVGCGWLLLLGSFRGVAHAGPLKGADEEAAGTSSGKSTSSRASRSSGSSSASGCEACSDDDDDDGGVLALLVLRGMAEMVIFPWKAPYLMLEGEDARAKETNRCLTRYAAIPYDSAPGVLRDGCNPQEEGGRRVKLLSSMESGYMVQGVLPTTLTARLLLPKRAELSFRADYLRDLHDPAEQAFAGTALLSVRFAQSQRAQFRTGAGMRLFHLTTPRWGLDLFYAFDIYGRHPVVFRGELHGGFVQSAGVFQARATLGGMLGRMELFAGGEYTYMSDGNGRGVPLGGPVAGVRAWF